MDREELITKWLEGELGPDELRAFQNLPEYGAYQKIHAAAENSRPAPLDIDREFDRFKSKLDVGPKARKRMRTGPWIGVAASVVIAVGFFFIFFTDNSTVARTQVAERTELDLPDESKVVLNSVSTVTYKEDDWEGDRRLSLKGEAFFHVAKGASFTVETDIGNVTVLGTRFNVRQRDALLDVSCFEGRVRVVVRDRAHILEKGRTLSVRDRDVSLGRTFLSQPSWVEGRSSFQSVPFSEVLEELGRQYSIEIDARGVDTSRMFTGSFVHDDLELAVRAITQPFKLTYELADGELIIRSYE